MSINIETSLVPLTEALRSGELNLSTYLDQLETHFTPENERVQAFLPEEGRFERLQREATALEARYPEPKSRPPLYGVPIGVKDIFHVEGFSTKAGSKLPQAVLTASESESVTRLKEAGALILGKTVTTEFAYFAPGPTRNPHNINHTPGGSSSGSAAAVAAQLSPLTLGTQTIGSITRPASFCGIVGFKPNISRISSKNVIPLSPTVDHVGFFTSDVAGAILAATVLCIDWRSPVPPSRRREIAKPILAIPVGPYLQKAETKTLAHFEKTQKKLEQAGYTVLQIEMMSNFEQIYTQHNDLVAWDMARVHAEWFAEYSNLYHAKSIALIEKGQQISPEQALASNIERKNFRQELIIPMKKHNIALWIAPSALGPAPAGLDSTGDPIMNLPWTYAGLPTLNLPSGSAQNGLPLGLQLIGGWHQDEKVLAWAKEIAKVVE